MSAAKEASNQKKLSDREQAIYNLICENKHLTVEQVIVERRFLGFSCDELFSLDRAV